MIVSNAADILMPEILIVVSFLGIFLRAIFVSIQYIQRCAQFGIHFNFLTGIPQPAVLSGSG